MTDQYQESNINQPRGSRDVAVSGDLNLDDDLVVVSTVGGPVTLTLPTAETVPGLTITVKTNDSGTSGNPVTVATQPGETIDGAASASLTTDQESLTVQSDGQDWRQVAGGSGGGGGGSDFYVPFGDVWLAAAAPDPAAVAFGSAASLPAGPPPGGPGGIAITSTSAPFAGSLVEVLFRLNSPAGPPSTFAISIDFLTAAVFPPVLVETVAVPVTGDFSLATFTFGALSGFGAGDILSLRVRGLSQFDVDGVPGNYAALAVFR